jgi:hypothetical protein
MHTDDAGLIIKFCDESHMQSPLISITKLVAAEQFVHTVAEEQR